MNVPSFGTFRLHDRHLSIEAIYHGLNLASVYIKISLLSLMISEFFYLQC